MRKLLALAGTAAVAAGASGVRADEFEHERGQRQGAVVQNCGSCHVLERAGATGVNWPNLDQALHRARSDGSGESTFEGIVRAEIRNPNINALINPATGDL